MSDTIKKHVKDPGSAITHFIGMLMAVFAAVPLIIKATHEPSPIYVVSIAIYAASLILLYAASTTYHTFDRSEKINTILKKIDHMMISVLIAGSYTPICLLVLGGRLGIILLAIVWSIAIAGILIKAFWVYCPKWVSSVLYIGMGWTCVLAFTQLLNSMSPAAFGWLLAGGLIYTAGGIIYALKLPIFNMKHKDFGSHEIFHLFVMGGSICHFVVMMHLFYNPINLIILMKTQKSCMISLLRFLFYHISISESSNLAYSFLICKILLSGVGRSSGIVPPISLIVSLTFFPTSK